MSKNKNKKKSTQFTPDTESVLVASSETVQETVSAPPEGVPSTPESEEARWARIEARRKYTLERRDALGAIGDQKLVAPTRPGFYRRWINDDGNRLAERAAFGYDFVVKGAPYSEGAISTDPGEKISQIVGTTKSGPLRAYLMEIPQDWVDEDRSKKEQKRGEVEAQVHRAAHGENNLAQSGRSIAYDPTNGNSHFDT